MKTGNIKTKSEVIQKLLGDKVKKVFVTGGAGFIGSHLVDILVMQRYDVVAYDNLSNGHHEFIEHNLSKPNFHFVGADILDQDRLATEMKGLGLLLWNVNLQYQIARIRKQK
jgi:FlaA1/EpsC-like NDP-sugar epimerase